MVQPLKHPMAVFIGIAAAYFSMSEFTLLTPAVDSLAHAFPHYAYTDILLANTVTGIVSVPVSIICGLIYNKAGFKKLAILGLIVVILGGIYPFFLVGTTEYSYVIISRVIVGIGLGAINPVGAALVTRFFRGATRVRCLGVGNLVFFGGGVAFQLLGGALCTIGWNYTFLGYLLGIIPFILIIVMLVEPEPIIEPTKEERRAQRQEKIPGKVFGYCFLWLVFEMLQITLIMLMSTVVAELNIGNAFIAGVCGSMITLGGMFGGGVFSFLLRKCNKFTHPVLWVIAAIGGIGLFFSKSLGSILFFAFIDGAALIATLSYVQYRIGVLTPPARIGFAQGFLQACYQVGTFLGSYYIAVVAFMFPMLGTMGTRLISGCIFLIGAVILFVVAVRAPRFKIDNTSEADGGNLDEA